MPPPLLSPLVSSSPPQRHAVTARQLRRLPRPCLPALQYQCAARHQRAACCRCHTAGKLPLPPPPPLPPRCHCASHCSAAADDTTLPSSCRQAAKLAAVAVLPPPPMPPRYCHSCTIATVLLPRCSLLMPCCRAATWSAWESLGELGRVWKCFGALERAGEHDGGRASWGRICPLA